MPSSLSTLSTFSLWSRCSDYLHDELSSQQFDTWIKPLCVEGVDSELGMLSDRVLTLQAPNRFVKNWVASKFQSRISELARLLSDGEIDSIRLDAVGSSGVSQSPLNQSTELLEAPLGSFAADDARSLAQPIIEAQPSINMPDPQEADNSQFPKISFGADRQPARAPMSNGFAKRSINAMSTEEPWNKRAVSTDTQTKGNFLDKREITKKRTAGHQNNVLDRYRFDNLVEGKSNQMAVAAAKQMVENPETSYNPLFLYGGVGLGKTHLMHAVGNEIKRRKSNAKVVYLHSERFVGDMVKALQLNAIDDFKRYYRSVDALLIDDIQFFEGKDRSQEEFFHTFNALLEGGHQMIFSCDRYPKAISGIEERLKSRFGWGLTVQIEPPELEMRVAILKHKAEQEGIDIPNDAAFFMAQRVRANGRDLEGSLKRVYANSQFQKTPITVELVKESLSDLLALQDKLVSIDNIQRTAAEYYNIKLSDLLSKRRTRSLARPRQVAMAIAKELTRHSLPEIGEAFGSRDHTTVLHAVRKVKELRESSNDVSEDYRNLVRLLST